MILHRHFIDTLRRRRSLQLRDSEEIQIWLANASNFVRKIILIESLRSIVLTFKVLIARSKTLFNWFVYKRAHIA